MYVCIYIYRLYIYPKAIVMKGTRHILSFAALVLIMLRAAYLLYKYFFPKF